MKCMLPEDINTCPFCVKEGMSCNNKERCSFQEEVVAAKTKNTKYVRQKRWYEKYYRKKKV